MLSASIAVNCIQVLKKMLYLAVASNNKIMAEMIFLHDTRSCEVHWSSVTIVIGHMFKKSEFWQWHDHCQELMSLQQEFQRDYFKLTLVLLSKLNYHLCLECVSWVAGVLLPESFKRHTHCVAQDSSVIGAKV